MKIFITCPNINSRHGGIRVIIEWANRLHLLGHSVYLQGSDPCNWMDVVCNITSDKRHAAKCDCIIVTSPHGIEFLSYPVKKKFAFVQMMEHLFNPGNKQFHKAAMQLYSTPYPLFSISKWNIEEMNRAGATHYIGNGVNLYHFPVEYPAKSKVVLLESPIPTNDSKDTDRIALRVAWQLSKLGYTIKGYGFHHCDIDEFHVKPDLQTMNRLYSEATILLKCTKYDARSTSPMEAMTKGCVTVRGIIKGDDDLIEENSYRCGYDYEQVLSTALFALNNPEVTDQKAKACYEYVQTYTWDYWMKQINEILCA